MIAFRSLFANNALIMIKALLDQPRQDSMRILGCMSLVDFIRVQVRLWSLTASRFLSELDSVIEVSYIVFYV